jgi:hypothetical protein
MNYAFARGADLPLTFSYCSSWPDLDILRRRFFGERHSHANACRHTGFTVVARDLFDRSSRLTDLIRLTFKYEL